MAVKSTTGYTPSKARALVDKVKARAALTGFSGTAAVFFGLAMHPLRLWQSLASTAGAAVRGNFMGVGSGITDITNHAFHPDGLGRYAFKGAMLLQGAAFAAVGGLELYQGLKNKDHCMGVMGVADLIGATSACMVAAGSPLTAISLSVLSSACMVALVASSPRQFSKVQKVSTLCDATVTTSTICMMSGVAVLPALAISSIVSTTGTLYMNSPWFRHGVDAVAGRVMRLFQGHGHRTNS